jgi:hypothetical protein
VRVKAATVIQRNYRGYRARRELKGLGIDASTRWIHAVREAQWRHLTAPHARSLSDDGSPPDTSAGDEFLGPKSPGARQKWKKVSAIARRAGGDVDVDTSSSSSSSSTSDSDSGGHNETAEQKMQKRKKREEAKALRKQEARMMGLQYFLEMIDLKHRYGANLRVYHEEWKRADTTENFFYWLDHGEGRFVDIEACPREQLEREQVRYLSREERQYYLVKIDEEGRLCWAKNGARIDTSEKWKDSIHGIVPSDDPTPAYTPVAEGHNTSLSDTAATSRAGNSSSSSSLRSSISPRSSTSSLDHAAAARYADADVGADASAAKNPLARKIHHISPTAILNNLLRKTVRKNTWIFVADTSFRLYVGIKNSGAFQHSSFLQGSRISAAGLIRIRDGRLHSLSPLSGHYRPPASNFRAFVKSLREAGVDMSHVSVSKSYAVLVGLEAYVKGRKKVEGFLGMAKRRKKKVQDGYEEVKGRGKEPAAAGESIREGPEAAKREEEAKMMDENQVAAEVMQKLNLGVEPTEPKGQKGDGDREAGSTPAIAAS